MSSYYKGHNEIRVSEDPWDGSRVTAVATVAQRPGVSAVAWVLIAAILTALLLSSVTSVQAQFRVAPVVEPDPPPAKESLLLNRGELEVAADYLKLLVEVREAAEDYRDYFSRLEGDLAKENEARLSKLVRQLSDGRYASDYKRLSADLAKLQEMLTYSESQKEAAGADRKVLRLAESLRREFEFLRAELAEEIEFKIILAGDSLFSLEDIKLYVTSCVAEAQIDIREVHENIVLLRADLERVAAVEMTEAALRHVEISVLLEDLYPMPSVTVVNMPELADVPDVEFSVGERGHVVDIPPAPEYPFVLDGHKAISSRELIDSLVLPEKGMPIFIANASGSISAKGWNRPIVMVRSELTVSSGSKGETTRLLKNAKVELRTRDGRIFVETALPRLDDPDVQILDARIEISAPATSPLVIKNSFGPTTISHFSNGLKVMTDFSEVNINSIKGATEVVSRMGTLHLKDVKGDIKIKGSHTPISLKSCTGKLEIDNELSAVLLRDNRGNVKIHNSDHVSIIDHVGSVDIQNSDGLLEVRRLTGDLVARNEYQPILIEDVDGSVDLDNVLSIIETNSIRGSLKANADGGTIEVLSPRGPIYLSGSGGDIIVTLTDPLRGPSSIVSSSGNIKLRLSERSNIALTTLTVGGMITSSFPIKVDREGESSQVILQIGRAANKLKVMGENSNIDLGMLK